MTKRVILLDLRDCDTETALIRARVLIAEEPDLTHLLVLDSAAEVAGHRPVFEALDKSNRVEVRLCLLIGHQSRPHELRLPENLERHTLWVPDPAGIDWPYRASAKAKLHTGAVVALTRLQELLLLPAVFLRTVKLLEEIPFGIACPALWQAEADGGEEDDFPWALRLALEQVLSVAEPVLDPVGDDLIVRSVASGDFAPSGGSPLDRSISGVNDAIAYAEEIGEEAVAVRGLWGTVEVFLVAKQDIAARLAALKDELAGLMLGVRKKDDPRKLIIEQGIPLADDQEFEIGEVRRALERSSTAWLREAKATLPQVEESLAAWAKALETSGGHRRKLDGIFSAELLRVLRTCEPFPPPQGWLPVVGAAVSALAGLNPVGLVTGVLMALVWTGLVVFTVTAGPGARIGDQRGPIAKNALAALAGGIVGGLLGIVGLPLPIWAAGAVLSVVAAPLAMRASWRVRCREWVAGGGIVLANGAVGQVLVLLGRVAADWSGTVGRANVKDAIGRFEFAVRGVSLALQGRATELDRELSGHRAAPAAPYVTAVEGQLVDLILAALRPAYDGIADLDLNMQRDNAKAEAENLLAAWKRHVRERGPVEPPEFAYQQGTSAAPDRSEELGRLTRAAGFDAAAEMWQLCSAEDLPLLSVENERRPNAVRFAPSRGRPAFESEAPPDTVWVPATVAGVLRLVSLRPGTVDWTWTDEPFDDRNGEVR